MENRCDFLERMGSYASRFVFVLLDDPSDLVRASAVSRSWRRFVVTNAFSRTLCRRICTEVSSLTHVIEVSSSTTTPAVGSSTGAEWESIVGEHGVYAYLSHCLVASEGKRACALRCISASSTDNFPDESVKNTLESRDRVDFRPSYWSSRGEADPDVPESLMYKLESDLCAVDEIKIQPFQAYFQSGWPIYAAKFVRFRMGSSKVPLGPENYVSDENEGRLLADDNYIWTYSSPEFPMLQENMLQSFKLPRPVLCIGGVLKVELLGRVKKQAMDDLYFVCVSHVEVLGRPLSPKRGIDSSEASDASVPKYFPDAEVALTVDKTTGPSSWTENILNALLRPLQLTEIVESSTEQKPLSDSS